ncbi:MAG: hypothetical protein R2844_00220 [Caldilineales bacterium]
MSVSVLVALPEYVYHRAENIARLTSRDVADVLADTIEISLPSVNVDSEHPLEIKRLSDDAVLVWAGHEMEPDEDRRLSYLLGQQQEGLLTETERMELAALMQLYQEGLLRKAQALAEAVHRGLIPRIGP